MPERAPDRDRRQGAPVPTAGVDLRRRARVLLVVLLAVDLVLVVNHATRYLVVRADEARAWMPGVWEVTYEDGAPELWGQLKLALGAALLVWLWRSGPGRAVDAAWAVLLAVVVLDDGFALHERGGTWLVDRLDLPAPSALRPQDTGEVLVWVALFALPVLGVLVAHRRSAPEHRRRSRRLALLVALLAACAVGLDMVHAAVGDGTVGEAVGILEDGGELAVMSLILAAVVAMVTEGRPARSDGLPELLSARSRPVSPWDSVASPL